MRATAHPNRSGTEVRGPGGGAGPASGPPTGRAPARPAHPPARSPAPSREVQRTLIDTWKWRATVIAAVAFGAFWVLAFGHPVGTAAQGSAAGGNGGPNANQPATGSQPTANPYFNGANQNNGGFFGRGNSGGLGGGVQPPVLSGGGS